jgi:CBS domain containing-hemolysin-like protein
MHGEKNALDEEESTIIMGALEMIEKKAEDAMTSIENAYMLEETTLLDAETIKQVPTRPSISLPPIHIHKSNTHKYRLSTQDTLAFQSTEKTFSR